MRKKREASRWRLRSLYKDKLKFFTDWRLQMMKWDNFEDTRRLIRRCGGRRGLALGLLEGTVLTAYFVALYFAACAAVPFGR